MRNHPSPPVENPRPAAQLTSSRATREATERFARRFRERFADDFYRSTPLGLTISSIGLGTYLGDTTIDDDAAYRSSAHHAVARGINILDTAINYRAQRSEQALCVAIQEMLAAGEVSRDELVVCTKGGYIPLDRTLPPTRDAYRAYVEREFVEREILQADDIVAGGHSLAPRFLRYCMAKSRQNLGLRSIDVYYLHNPEQQLTVVDSATLLTRVEAAFRVLEEAIERGDIGTYGVATWDGLRTHPEQAGHLSLEALVDTAHRVAGKAHGFRAVQLPISLAMPEAFRSQTQVVGGRAMTVIDAAAELGLAVIGSATLMQSRLAAGLPQSIREHFSALGTDAQRAIAFAREMPGVSACLVGMKQPAHVDENLGAARR